MSAYTNGREAYKYGRELYDNPYDLKTAEHQEWVDGWYDEYYCDLGI